MSDEFAKGSVIVCPQCWRPVFALERGIGPLDRAGRAASAFRPLRQDDIAGLLVDRPDVPPLWQANVAEWWQSEASYRTRQAARPNAGDAAICPNCGGQWVRFVERLEGSALDRGYQVQLLDIPPAPVTSGQMDRARWIADVEDDRELTIEERELS